MDSRHDGHTGLWNDIPAESQGFVLELDKYLTKKCKNMAFFHSLTEENYDAIKKLIRSELGE